MSSTLERPTIDPAAVYTGHEVARLVPGLSYDSLAQMRCRGRGPRYVQHAPRASVLYRGCDLIDWLAANTHTPENRT